MIRKVDSRTMGKADHGWLKSLFHFSFADYYNPENIHFGALRVLNDDIILPQTGFDLHPHRDMEIVSYCISGHLTHGDSMGNKQRLSRGDFQYMSAGTGVYHSEMNEGDVPGRFLQIWIMPDQKGHSPQYGDLLGVYEKSEDQWFHSVSSITGDAPIKIHQDVNIYVGRFKANETIHVEVPADRQVYLVQIEGSSSVDDLLLNEKDALEIRNELLNIHVKVDSHYLMIEMAKA